MPLCINVLSLIAETKEQNEVFRACKQEVYCCVYDFALFIPVFLTYYVRISLNYYCILCWFVSLSISTLFPVSVNQSTATLLRLLAFVLFRHGCYFCWKGMFTKYGKMFVRVRNVCSRNTYGAVMNICNSTLFKSLIYMWLCIFISRNGLILAVLS